MSRVEAFHNDFYSHHLLELDDQGNTFEKIESLLPPLEKGSRILDIGCGGGNVSAALVPRGMSVHGVDVQAKAIEMAKRRGIHAELFDFQEKSLAFEASSFDIVLLLDVLEHLYDPMFTLKEAFRVLKPTGSIIISLPLHFDIIQRVRVLFGRGILSYDNIVYGEEIARKICAYNYDHIRFFTIQDIDRFLTDTHADVVIRERKYVPASLGLALNGRGGRLTHWMSKLFFNSWTVERFPSLFASNVKLVIGKKA